MAFKYHDKIISCYSKNSCSYCDLNREFEFKQCDHVFLFRQRPTQYALDQIIEYIETVLDEEEYEFVFMVNAKTTIDMSYLNTFLKCGEKHVKDILTGINPKIVYACDSISFQYISGKKIHPDPTHKKLINCGSYYLVGMYGPDTLFGGKTPKNPLYNANVVNFKLLLQVYSGIINNIKTQSKIDEDVELL